MEDYFDCTISLQIIYYSLICFDSPRLLGLKKRVKVLFQVYISIFTDRIIVEDVFVQEATEVNK